MRHATFFSTWMRAAGRGVAAVTAAVLVLTLVPVGAAVAADDADSSTITIGKTVNDQKSVHATAGTTVSYALVLSCSSLTDVCTDATLKDTVPAPLVLNPGSVQVTGGAASTYAVTTSGNALTVKFFKAALGGKVGMEDGAQYTIRYTATLPAGTLADHDGASLVNTASLTASNALISPVTDTATVIPTIPTTLASTVTKSVAPTQLPAVRDSAVTYTLGGANSSNRSVDSLVIQDPATGVTPTAFAYVALTGITTLTPPTGANRVQLDWLDGSGTWHTGAPVAIPSNPSSLLAGITAADVKGTRFTFTVQGGQLPVSTAPASIVLATTTSAAAGDVTQSTTVTNTAGSHVVVGATTSPDVTKPANLVLVPANLGPVVQKAFGVPSLLAGASTVATVKVSNGDYPITTMTLAEPQSGHKDLAEQGLTFAGFVAADVEWPVGATHASITYAYDTGAPTTAGTSTRDTLPAPAAGRTVTGFDVTFTGPMAADEYAVVPFTVTALAADSGDVTETNWAAGTVETSTGQTGTDHDSADLTRRALRVATTLTKTFTPDTMYDVPGTGTVVQLESTVKRDLPVGSGSTIGAQSLVVSDPQDPTAGPDAFWNLYDVRSIAPTDVPAGSRLTVEYWDGSAWSTFGAGAAAGVGVQGPTRWSYVVPAGVRDSVEGIRFTFTPTTAGALLQPGYTVVPALLVGLRATARDGGATSVTTDTDVTNTARTTATNLNASPTTGTAVDDAVVTLLPSAGGSGPNLVDKLWRDSTGAYVQTGAQVVARSGDTATARLAWSTGGLSFAQVSVADPATATPGVTTGTVYDAFDLVRIAPITSATDSRMTFDKVSEVWRYSAASGAWVNITTAACAAGCDGVFGGYTLSAAEQADTLAVRLVFVESPTRAARATGALDPAVGTGVAATTGRRAIDLEFRVRDTLRSDPSQAVLGSTHPLTYNSGEQGVVSNDVSVVGTLPGGGTFDSTDGASVTVSDSPLNVNVTKTWAYGPLGVPQAGTDPDLYPIATATIVATNQTVGRVDELVVADPDPSATTDDPFTYLNLYEITDVTVPSGTTTGASTVTLRFRDPATTVETTADYTIAQAKALTPAQLQDVIGIEVRHTGRIVTDATTRLTLAFQLRSADRYTAAALPTPAVGASRLATNTVLATVLDAGGLASQNGSATDDDTEDIAIVAPSYAVTAAKAISPDTTNEDSGTKVATVTLGAQLTPQSSVRTRQMVYTDISPTFWNAYDFTSLSKVTLVAPVKRFRVDALVGVSYVVDPTTQAISTTCGGVADLTDCWRPGAWTTATPGVATTAVLPAGVTAGQVRGLRYALDNNGGAWQRPSNPNQTVTFTATRRATLVTGGAVPSTRPSFTKAPGESQLGVTTNTFTVDATGAWNDDLAPWTDSDSATDTIKVTHTNNAVAITKSPTGAVAPGGDIPYQIAVRNAGSRPMTGVRVTDVVEQDGDGPLLVLPDREPLDTTPIFTFALTNASGTAQTAPAVTVDTTAYADDGTITFALPSGYALPVGYTLTITANLEVRADLPSGQTIANSATVASDRIFDTCTFTASMASRPSTTAVTTCTSTTSVYTLPASPMRVVKGVKGVGAGLPTAAPGDASYDDLGVLAYSGAPSTAYCENPNTAYEGYYRTPCIPITRPGGTEQWKTWLSNTGNVPATVVSAIDVLPAVDDRGVIINQARSSRWAPVLTGHVAATFTDASGNPLTYDSADGVSLAVQYSTTVPVTVCNRIDILNTTRAGGATAADLNPTSFPGETTACLAGGANDVNARTWHLYDESMPAADKAKIKALKYVLTYSQPNRVEGLLPGQTLAVSYRSTTAAFPARAETSDRDSIAWNSVAAGARGVATDGTKIVTPVTEVRKTGVAMATGKLDLRKLVEGGDSFATLLPTSYDFTLECTSLGQDVPLLGVPVGSSTPDLSSVTVPADGSVLEYNNGIDAGEPGHDAWSAVNLPAYATCSAVEDPSQGAEVTYAPSTVTAHRDFVTRADVARPAATDGSAAAATIERITATNTYAEAGFSVSKLVDASGAQDADGAAITYPGPYSFTAECTFLGHDVLDTTFTLAPGDDPQEYAGLPAGSACSVTETGVPTGANASTVVTQGGVAGFPGAGPTTSFTLTADDADGAATTQVAVTNTYAVGAVAITKVVDGLGSDDWGNEQFEVDLECTLAGASPETVFHGSHALSKASPSWTVENLASGASCTVTETAFGAATEHEVDPGTFVVGDDESDPTAVTVTNTFGTGSLRVSKELAGEPAASLTPATTGTYTVSLACTRDVDGTEQEITVPGGATRTITGAGSATYTGLPSGAQCTVTETDLGHAQSHALEPADGVVTIDEADTAEVVVTNTFDNGEIAVRKDVSGVRSDLAPATFDATVTCTWHGADVALPDDGAVVLTDGVETVIHDVPLGSLCSVTEAGGTGATSVTYGTGDESADPSVDPVDVEVGDGSDDADLLTIRNAYDAAALTVRKVVDASSQVADDLVYSFTLECTYDGKPLALDPADAAFDLLAGGSRTVEELPIGTECEVVETGTHGALVGYRVGTSTVLGSDGTVTVPADGQTITVENAFSALELTKDVAQTTVQGGDDVDYTLTVENTGPAATSDVRLHDELPAAIGLVSLDAPAPWECTTTRPADRDVVDCVYAAGTSLDPGVTAPVVAVHARVADDIAVDEIVNDASVRWTDTGSPQVDPPVREDDDDAPVLVKWIDATVSSACVADVPWLSYDIDPRNVDMSTHPVTISWFADADHDGVPDGDAIRVDTIPAGGALTGKMLWPGAAVDADGIGIAWPGWRQVRVGETPVWENQIADPTLPEYALRAGALVRIEVNPTLRVEQAYPDATPLCEVARTPDLEITKTASVEKADRGDKVSYALDVRNTGLGATDDVVVTDQVPATLKVLSVKGAKPADDTTPRWTCEVSDRASDGGGGLVRCVLGGWLGRDQSAPTITVSARVLPTAAGDVVNSATVTWSDPDTGGDVTKTDTDDATVTVPKADPPAVDDPPAAEPPPALSSTGADGVGRLALLAVLLLLLGAVAVRGRRRGEA
ncbi:DUF5979 domain-containing protein [Cellulomonas sp. PhB150]|uniref:DUF5979 domain-containing protein n=1 Tax=Cellulomonas sp. PhB150 TaxID=2485188 RepID=UPI000F484DEC|nr:DUF5979 domain-containing protein [Cellulomonas sp. PhB150]ROS31554.1 putative repeat protein (TIGR01451 family)/fimbrial isopeptide formation D2 family protein [Cellulomonas sp. PhB150]